MELEPTFFDKNEERGSKVSVFARTFFEMGGVQINLNVIELQKLIDAMKHPEDRQYEDIVVKVTGYSAHFVGMDRRFQEEFVQRVNYKSV